ncbi:sel1 repeat family protein [Vibrio sp. AK197]
MIKNFKSTFASFVVVIALAYAYSFIKPEGIALSGIENYAYVVPKGEAKSIGFELARRKDYRQAEAFFLRSAERGDISSQLALGVLYYYDDTKDHFKFAYQWFSKNSNNPLAQYFLSLHYLFGDYVAKDEQRSLFWLKQSADKSFPAAQYNQAVMYLNKHDYINAYLWASYARKNGLSDAGDIVKTSLREMTVKDKAYAEQTYLATIDNHLWQANGNLAQLLDEMF